jgi:hypothetical protein
MEGFDPLLPFNIGPANGREARESGLWPKARVAPRTSIASCCGGRMLIEQ